MCIIKYISMYKKNINLIKYQKKCDCNQGLPKLFAYYSVIKKIYNLLLYIWTAYMKLILRSFVRIYVKRILFVLIKDKICDNWNPHLWENVVFTYILNRHVCSINSNSINFVISWLIGLSGDVIEDFSSATMRTWGTISHRLADNLSAVALSELPKIIPTTKLLQQQRV